MPVARYQIINKEVILSGIRDLRSGICFIRGEKMSKKAWIIIVLSILVVFVLLGFNAQQKAIVTVKTAKVDKGEITYKVFPTGVVKADEQVKISSKAGGRLISLGIKEGDSVRKAQLIARIDDADLLAQLAQFQATIEQSKIDLESNKKNYERMKTLFDDKAITDLQMETAEAQYKTSQARLSQSQAQLEQIKVQLSNAKIYSPISGIIFQKYVNQGEIIGMGSPIVTVYNPSSLMIEVNVDEADVGKIKLGQYAEIALDAYPGEKVEGVVTYIASASQDVKEKGVTFLVRVAVKKTNVVLRLGMTADVDIFIETKKDIARVSLDAVGEKDNKRFVYIIEKGKAKKQEVSLGLENDEYAEILSGIKVGDEVIIGNLDKLADGKTVKIMNNNGKEAKK